MAKKYPEHEKEKALIAAATLGIRPAARQLGLPWETIRQWIRDQPDRYAKIREQESPKWRARAAAEFEDVVDALSDLEAKAAENLAANLDKLEPKDTATALKNISLAKGVNATHVSNLRGQPTEIIEHRHDLRVIESLIREREQIIEGEARELPELEAGQQG